MNAYITGIGGFVGKHLARQLLAEGNSVYGIDRHIANIPGCHTEACDILDTAKLEKSIRIAKPDMLFHLAATSTVGASFENPELTFKVNVDGTRNVLLATERTNPNASVLVVSTAHVYGPPQKLPITEEHALNPKSPYAESRVEQEKVARESPLKVVISRSFNHTGPGQMPGFVCTDYARQVVLAEQGQREILVGDLTAKRDFTDVGDMVKAYILAVNAKPGTYNICSGKAYSARQILDILLLNSKAKPKITQDLHRKPGDILELVGDHTKFSNETKWQPRIPFETTLKDILEYWRLAEPSTGSKEQHI